MPYIKYTLFIIFISCFSVYSQNNQFSYSLKIDSAVSLYKKQMHKENDCITGKEYKLYHSYNQDNPYLNSHHGLGVIYNKGYIFNNKTILYDIFKDEVIIKKTYNRYSNININIQKSQIDSFLIEFENKKYLLKHIRANNSSHNEIKSGFYEIPYKGKYQLLLKHKVKKGSLSGITTYTYEISKFLKIGNAYFNINSRKKLFELFYNSKKQLKKRFRLLRTPYKELTSTQLIDLIKYIETL